MKKEILQMINTYLKKGKCNLTQFQLECLDYIDDILSSIEYGINDIEVSMEIWKENDFYILIDTKGNIIKEY